MYLETDSAKLLRSHTRATVRSFSTFSIGMKRWCSVRRCVYHVKWSQSGVCVLRNNMQSRPFRASLTGVCAALAKIQHQS